MAKIKLLDCVIIGGGPAGIMAAIYLSRFRRKIKIFDDNDSRASLIPSSHNFPGAVNGITGISLLTKLRQQLSNFNCRVESKTVLAINANKSGFYTIHTSRQNLATRFIILATGIQDNPINMDQSIDIKGKIVWHHCPVCDGYEMIGKKIIMLGSGSNAIKEASFLKKYTADITLFTHHYKPALTKKQIQQTQHEQIALVQTTILAIKQKHNKVIITTDDKKNYLFDAIYTALGTKLKNKLPTIDTLKKSADGCVVTDRQQRTNLKNIYAIGDMVVGLKQISVGIGQAAIAACDINTKLDKMVD